jgi:hypothetical protein
MPTAFLTPVICVDPLSLLIRRWRLRGIVAIVVQHAAQAVILCAKKLDLFGQLSNLFRLRFNDLTKLSHLQLMALLAFLQLGYRFLQLPE